MRLLKDLLMSRASITAACAGIISVICGMQRQGIAGDEAFPEPAPSVKTYEWTVSPAKELDPALKYRLLTDLSDSVPGNAAVYYQRAILLKADPKPITPEELERQNSWRELPLDQLPLDDVRAFLNQKRNALDELQKASQCESCDWGVRFQDLRGYNVLDVRLNEFHEARDLARILRLKSRLEIAERRFDDAMDTIRQGCQLSRNLMKPASVITNLIAIAIQSLMNDAISELIVADNSPNLYWALQSLPDSSADVLAAFYFESMMAFRTFPFLKDAETAQRSPSEWQRLLTQAVVQLNSDFQQQTPVQFADHLQVTPMIIRGYPIAKRYLLEKGGDPARIEEMPVGQVIAIYARDCHLHFIDASFKWMMIPFSLGSARLRESLDELRRDEYVQSNPRQIPLRDPLLINSRLGFLTTQYAEASNRMKRQIAALGAVEAIRMQAAHDKGVLPKSLSDIRVVPVPLNPGTGKPFLYRVVDQRAELLIPPSDPSDEYAGRRFLIRLR